MLDVAALAGVLPGACLPKAAGLIGNLGLLQCLSVESLLPALTGNDIVPTIDSWLGSMCNATACTKEDLKAGTDVFNSTECLGNSSDVTVVSILNMALSNYDTVRPALCKKNNATFCVTETLNTVQNVGGEKITFDIVKGALGNNATALTPFTKTLEAGKLCTTCVKGLVDDLGSFVPNTNLTTSFNAKCPNVTDGPGTGNSSVTSNTASPNATNTSKPDSGAVSLNIASGSIGAVAAGALAFSAYIL